MSRSHRVIYVPKILGSHIPAYEKQKVCTLSDFPTHICFLRIIHFVQILNRIPLIKSLSEFDQCMVLLLKID